MEQKRYKERLERSATLQEYYPDGNLKRHFEFKEPVFNQYREFAIVMSSICLMLCSFTILWKVWYTPENIPEAYTQIRKIRE